MKVLAIAPHADDETLGCGGTLLRHQSAGDELHWMIVTAPFQDRWTADAIMLKASERVVVAACYGATTHELSWDTTTLDTLGRGSLMWDIERALTRIQPERIYVVHPGDINSDHAPVFDALLTVLKPFRMARFGVREILAYETLSSSDAAAPPHARPFTPTVYHDITPYLDRKLEILALYQTEAQPEPLPRSPSAVRALARVRGATIGVDYAEAFELIRRRA